MSEKNRIQLDGCTPTPLSAYLKALGVFRIVAEQKDPEARGFWDQDRFVLLSALTPETLVRFFLNEYAPTPIFAPWNGGSGFFPKDNQSGISRIETAASSRFKTYAEIIGQARQILAERDMTEKPEKKQKPEFLAHLRARLHDEALPWMDAAIVLAGGDPKYPPLLGTGGNDGRLDFTNNFMRYLTVLFSTKTGKAKKDSDLSLRGAIFAEANPKQIPGKPIGQFFPGAVGGPNATTGFGSDSIVNPWDFVLMLEGSILFAASATRKLEGTGTAAMSYPFTVRNTGSGTGAAAISDESSARAEMWLPLWHNPSALSELRALFSEGRATLGRRSVRDGIDFVRAVTNLGVDRGIDSFQRFGFFMRSGKAYLATPMNRVRASRSPHGDLIEELDRDRWLSRFRGLARGTNTPGRFKSLAQGLENRIFELVRAGSRSRMCSLLIHLGKVQLALADLSGTDKMAVPPIPSLSHRWIAGADDGSDEFAIAAALASVYTPGLPMAAHIYPLDRSGKKWNRESRLCCWDKGSISENLIRIMILRLRAERQFEKKKANHAGKAGSSPDTNGGTDKTGGLEPAGLEFSGDKPFGGSRGADPGAVESFLFNKTDDRRIAQLLPGLVLARARPHIPPDEKRRAILPAGYLLARLLVTPNKILVSQGLLPPEKVLPVPMEFIASLRADRINTAMNILTRRLTASSVQCPRADLAMALSGPRLAASLMIPMKNKNLYRLFKKLGIETQTKQQGE